jgi:hypothetical protein
VRAQTVAIALAVALFDPRDWRYLRS